MKSNLPMPCFPSTLKEKKTPCQGNLRVEFPEFLDMPVVNGQNYDIWEFGKGALSELGFCGVAVLQSMRR
jgi:hypothetical protein